MLPPENVHRRLLYILHHGLVELRNAADRQEQVSHLADLLEVIPVWMVRWEDQYLDVIRSQLQTYRLKYPHSYEYLKYLDGKDLPKVFEAP